MNVVAYNVNDVKARNLLAQVDEQDLLVQQIPCSCRMEVTGAYFCDRYNGARCLHTPMMMVEGKVLSVYIEDDDDRVFPTGTKEITLGTPQLVQFEYDLTKDQTARDELKQLISDGLYLADFEPPENLIGNVVEFPLISYNEERGEDENSGIIYKGVYDTPITVIEVVNAYKLRTWTSVNNYYGIFNACKVPPEIVAERQSEGYVSTNEAYLNESLYQNTDTNEYDNNPLYQTEDQMEGETYLTDEQLEDLAIQKNFEKKMQEHMAESEQKKNKKNEDFNAAGFLHELRDELAAEDEAQKGDSDLMNLYGIQDAGLDGKSEEEKRKITYEKMKQKLTRQTDVAADNKALNEYGSNADISGMGAEVPVDDKANKSEQKPKQKDHMSVNDQQNLAQQLLSGTFNPNQSGGKQQQGGGRFL